MAQVQLIYNLTALAIPPCHHLMEVKKKKLGGKQVKNLSRQRG